MGRHAPPTLASGRTTSKNLLVDMSFFKKLSIKEKGVYYKYLISYSLSSIIPLLILAYFAFQYIIPFADFNKPTKINPDEIRILTLLTLISSCLGFYIMLEVIRSLTNLASKAKSIDEFTKKTTSGISLKLERADEIGTISTSLEFLLEQIRAQFSRLNHLIDEVEYSRNALQESTEKLAELSIIDEKTGLFSANYIYTRLEEEIKRARHFAYKFSFVLISLDNLDNCFPNEKENYIATTLKTLGEIIKRHIREIDIVGRAGSEKLALITPNLVGNELLTCLGLIEKEFKEAFSVYFAKGLNISFGAAIYPESGNSKEKLVERTIELLVLAQQSRTNRIAIDHFDI